MIIKLIVYIFLEFYVIIIVFTNIIT